MSYSKALEKAKQNPKLIFVDLYADWCLPCRVMDANVYTDPTVASLLNSRFYAVKLDVDSKEKITCDGEHKNVQECMTQVWELSTLPSFVLLAPKGLSKELIAPFQSREEAAVHVPQGGDPRQQNYVYVAGLESEPGI